MPVISLYLTLLEEYSVKQVTVELQNNWTESFILKVFGLSDRLHRCLLSRAAERSEVWLLV